MNMSPVEFATLAEHFPFRSERSRLLAYEVLVNGASHGQVAKKWGISPQAVGRMVVRFTRQQQRVVLAQNLCKKYEISMIQAEEIISLVLTSLRMSSG